MKYDRRMASQEKMTTTWNAKASVDIKSSRDTAVQ
jgi:hypothetical protein